jgi:hypothetical protein
MTQIHYPSEQVEEWKTEMEEEGDPAIDVFFHEDTPQEESAEDSDSEGETPQEEEEVTEE